MGIYCFGLRDLPNLKLQLHPALNQKSSDAGIPRPEAEWLSGSKVPCTIGWGLMFNHFSSQLFALPNPASHASSNVHTAPPHPPPTPRGLPNKLLYETFPFRVGAFILLQLCYRKVFVFPWNCKEIYWFPNMSLIFSLRRECASLNFPLFTRFDIPDIYNRAKNEFKLQCFLKFVSLHCPSGLIFRNWVLVFHFDLLPCHFNVSTNFLERMKSLSPFPN